MDRFDFSGPVVPVKVRVVRHVEKRIWVFSRTINRDAAILEPPLGSKKAGGVARQVRWTAKQNFQSLTTGTFKGGERVRATIRNSLDLLQRHSLVHFAINVPLEKTTVARCPFRLAGLAAACVATEAYRSAGKLIFNVQIAGFVSPS